MKTYIIGICNHISADIILYWPIYENINILYDISTDICINFENENFHISLKKWKIWTYIDQYIIFGKNHISVNILLSYIGQYIIFNIDRYMLTYSEKNRKRYGGRNNVLLKTVKETFSRDWVWIMERPDSRDKDLLHNFTKSFWTPKSYKLNIFLISSWLNLFL